MDAALRELLTGLFDYAGLFPPASLAASDAVRTYADAREGDERWMLGRFVFPLQRRHEVVAGVDSLGEDFGPLAITGLLRGNAVEEDLAGFGGEVERDSLRVEAFEVRVPEPVAGTGSGRVAGWVEGVAGTLVDEGYSGIPLWIETGWGADGRARTEAAIRGLSALRTTRMPVGLKLRCGGATSADFPTSAMLAAAVVHCARAEVPFKATAGLHHPLPREDAAIGARMHGFLNLFGGAALARVHRLGERRMAKILAEDEPRAWRFEDGVLAWRDLAATADQVRDARRVLATSIGSCSFDEPRDDLRELGLL